MARPPCCQGRFLKAELTLRSSFCPRVQRCFPRRGQPWRHGSSGGARPLPAAAGGVRWPGGALPATPSATEQLHSLCQLPLQFPPGLGHLLLRGRAGWEDVVLDIFVSSGILILEFHHCRDVCRSLCGFRLPNYVLWHQNEVQTSSHTPCLRWCINYDLHSFIFKYHNFKIFFFPFPSKVTTTKTPPWSAVSRTTFPWSLHSRKPRPLLLLFVSLHRFFFPLYSCLLSSSVSLLLCHQNLSHQRCGTAAVEQRYNGGSEPWDVRCGGWRRVWWEGNV